MDSTTNAFLILEEKLNVQELAVFDYIILLLYRVQKLSLHNLTVCGFNYQCFFNS
jgi:hypothetical protein